MSSNLPAPSATTDPSATASASRATADPSATASTPLASTADPRSATSEPRASASGLVTQLAAQVRLLLMDVDGVLTDGKLYNVPGPDGKMAETKGFDSQDGIGLQWLAKLGIPTGLISGRVSPATVERANQCKFTYIYQGHTEKIPIINEILADAKIDPSQVAYIGDDFTDVVVMRRVGLSVATANARPEVMRIAHYVTQAPGGQGAVREVIELILKAQNRWEEILKHYEI